MNEIENYAKKHPVKTVVAGGGTSIFAIVFLMMLLYIIFDGKFPTINLPISFPAIPVEVTPTSYPDQPTSYVVPVSIPVSSPVSYP